MFNGHYNYTYRYFVGGQAIPNGVFSSPRKTHLY